MLSTPEFVYGQFSSSPHPYLNKSSIKPRKLWIQYKDSASECYEVVSRNIQYALNQGEGCGIRRLVEVT